MLILSNIVVVPVRIPMNINANLIFVTSTTSGACGEKICLAEKFST